MKQNKMFLIMACVMTVILSLQPTLLHAATYTQVGGHIHDEYCDHGYVDWSEIPHVSNVRQVSEYEFEMVIVPAQVDGRLAFVPANESLGGILEPNRNARAFCCSSPNSQTFVISEIHSFNTMGNSPGICVGVRRTVTTVCFACGGSPWGSWTETSSGCGSWHS